MSRRAPALRARRSHAERTAETRARLLEAVVASIAEKGFQKTTAAEIGRRAGVTWGAVQHHFGGKEGILEAVLEDSFARFARLLSGIETDGVPLAERVDRFIDRAWQHFASDHYRSTFEILLHYSGDPLWEGEMGRAWGRIWSGLFDDAGLPAARSATLQHYAISVLSGLAAMEMLGGRSPRRTADELALLKATLVRELTG